MLIMVPFIHGTYITIEDLKNKDYYPIGYEWPQITDFWVSFVIAFIFIAIDKFITYMLFPFFEKIANDQEDEVKRKNRANKAVKNVYKFLYYTSITVFGYIVLKDSHILPPTLGGSGSFYN